MAKHLDLEEQEQQTDSTFLERLGHAHQFIAVGGVGALAAWNGYQYWQSRQAFRASALMDAVDAAVAAKDQGPYGAGPSLICASAMRGTVQAGLAGLQLGKAQADAGNNGRRQGRTHLGRR